MKFEIKSVVLPLILLNIAVFVMELIFKGNFIDSFILTPDIFSRPWILLTHMFLHANANHIIFNMYTLLIFGPLLEQRIGVKRFLLVYLASGIVAGILSSFFYQRALGASAAIMGMIGVLIILMPGLRLLLFFVVPMPLWLVGILYALLDIFGIFYPSGVGNIAHLTGMAIGLLYGLHLKKEKRKFDRKFHSKRHLGKDDVDEYLKTGRI
jgi:membrane associated rhomboid family serine protease